MGGTDVGQWALARLLGPGSFGVEQYRLRGAIRGEVGPKRQLPLELRTRLLFEVSDDGGGVVKHLEVSRPWQGRGYATKMVELLIATFPEATWRAKGPSAYSYALFRHLAKQHPGVVLAPAA